MLPPEHGDGGRERRTIADVENDERRLRGARLSQCGKLFQLADGHTETACLHQLFELAVLGSYERRGQCCCHVHLIK